ncbi:MAG: mechanosensitive ion channel family protein [Elainellaceae cyanobacterium]
MHALIHRFHHRFHQIHRHLRIWLILSITVVLTIAIHPVQAQQSSPTGNQVDGYPVILDGTTLFRVKQGIPGIASAEERANIINERLTQLANDDAISPETIQVKEQEDTSVVLSGDTVLFTVRENDRFGDQSRQATAAKTVERIQSAVTQYRQDRSADQVIRGIIFTVVSTIALIGFLVLLQRFTSRLLIKIRAARRADALDVRIQNFQLLGSNATGYLLSGIVRILRLVLVLISFYLYTPFVLSQFPTTRAIGRSIFDDIAFRINQLVTTFVQYLPNLATIAIIAVITYYIIQFAKLVITELGRDNAYPWFYPEWIQPTNRLATILLVAIACIVAAPYLPGFNSPAFQGVSLFLGALFTLGSSSAVANAIAGVILIYTRAFRISDIIQIGETTGEVLEKSLFVTRLLTFKQEVITVPNASVLNSNVVNFNAISRESNNSLLLHTTITLGYDVPWRKVHQVLTQAATTTSGIVAEPSPFVLQTALNDFNVSYELNAYSDRPQLMPQIYSKLHQNIQDYCNQAGIEILSPGYSSIRDGNHSTIPSNYLPDDYTPPMFQVHYPDNQS